MLLNLSFHFELVRRFFSCDVDFSGTLSSSPAVENEGSSETLSLTSQWLVLVIFHPSLTRQVRPVLASSLYFYQIKNSQSSYSIPFGVSSGETLRKSLGSIKENEKKSSEKNFSRYLMKFRKVWYLIRITSQACPAYRNGDDGASQKTVMYATISVEELTMTDWHKR